MMAKMAGYAFGSNPPYGLRANDKDRSFSEEEAAE
jgi:hypothetical protein